MFFPSHLLTIHFFRSALSFFVAQLRGHIAPPPIKVFVFFSSRQGFSISLLVDCAYTRYALSAWRYAHKKKSLRGARTHVYLSSYEVYNRGPRQHRLGDVYNLSRHAQNSNQYVGSHTDNTGRLEHIRADTHRYATHSQIHKHNTLPQPPEPNPGDGF